jgi:hypothetical protein
MKRIDKKKFKKIDLHLICFSTLHKITSVYVYLGESMTAVKKKNDPASSEKNPKTTCLYYILDRKMRE